MLRSAHIALFLVLFAPCALSDVGAGLALERSGSETILRVGDQAPFHRTPNEVSAARLLRLDGGESLVATWTETVTDGERIPHYALGLRGAPLSEGRATSYLLRLRGGDLDPFAPPPAIAPGLAARAGSRLFIVQFVSQPLEAYRRALAGLGARVLHFLPHHAHIVELPPEAREKVAELEFVRWVGPYHPLHRLEEALRLDADALAQRLPKQRYSILLFESDDAVRRRVAARIQALGGLVDQENAGKHLMVATLSSDELLELVHWDEIAFVDRWSPLERDMDLVRGQGGADELEAVAGYTGLGVRGESFDTGFNVNHPDFASRPPLEHGGAVSNDSHGTACLGVCFGDGTGDARARGLMPDGQPIAADYSNVGLTGQSRYDHSGELLDAPYYAVFQTASVGSSRTTEYTTISADHDTLIFDWDLVHCQSQSNSGNQNSRPQAWAKNVVSVGGFNHYDTADTTDDCWCSTASIGPAADGRIKPDLSFYYDDTYTTYTTGDGYGEFGGTSGATPTVCGHFGLFFQMWSDGIFGNEVDPTGTVFENRPHATTAKAFLINTAVQYPFSGTDVDMTRVHQGWGVPNVKNLYDLRENISFIDESVLLQNTESADFNTFVEDGEEALRVTMVYADPAGNPAATIHRINDLTLKLTSPTGTVYWGNNGLLEGNWSTPGGAANTVDTVENVFVESPEAGLWLVTVTASEIVQDGHVETPELDADFALVVSGGLLRTCSDEGVLSLDAAMYACEDEATMRVVDCGLNLDDAVVETVTVTIDSDSEPAGESVVLTETKAQSATFTGSIPLSGTDGPGVLLVAEGDTVTATYIDADDGQGGSDIPRTDTASVDCSPPAISDVQTTDVQPHEATVTFTTDEEARGAVRFGTSCAGLDREESSLDYVTSHAIRLTGLADDTTYFYAVDATDEAGNTSTDDNAGLCYSFTTPEVPEAFTEEFSSDNDLDLMRLTFTPNGSIDFYSLCREPASAFRTDPAGGTPLSLGDDSSEEIVLSDGAKVPFYGVEYASLFVGSNGYVTFTSGDSAYSESLASHFDLPRVSALFDDLNPSSAGTISWEQLADRVAITFDAVVEYSSSDPNSFQIELFFDGTVAITYLELSATDGIAGLSRGEGTPEDFFETDLSLAPSCDGGQETVPGEAGLATQLLVTGYDDGTGVLSLSHGVPCLASDHVIEYGPLTAADIAGYAWSGQECGIGAGGTYDWDTSGAPASVFFVVVANNGSEEGSYGRSSDGSERPEDASSPSCDYPQNLADACE